LSCCVDPFFFGSNLLLCSPLSKLSKCPRSSNSEFRAKSYSRFSAERSVTGRWWPMRPVSTCESSHRVWLVFLSCLEVTWR
jgi:hypothetical protein